MYALGSCCQWERLTEKYVIQSASHLDRHDGISFLPSSEESRRSTPRSLDEHSTPEMSDVSSQMRCAGSRGGNYRTLCVGFQRMTLRILKISALFNTASLAAISSLGTFLHTHSVSYWY